MNDNFHLRLKKRKRKKTNYYCIVGQAFNFSMQTIFIDTLNEKNNVQYIDLSIRFKEIDDDFSYYILYKLLENMNVLMRKVYLKILT